MNLGSKTLVYLAAQNTAFSIYQGIAEELSKVSSSECFLLILE